MHSFHRFYQTAARQNLSMYKAKRAILDQRNNLKMFMMHLKLTASRAELADDKAVRNRGRCRGSGPEHPPPRRLGWKVKASGEAGGERGFQKVQWHHGGSGIPQEEGGFHQGEEGARLYMKCPNPS